MRALVFASLPDLLLANLAPGLPYTARQSGFAPHRGYSVCEGRGIMLGLDTQRLPALAVLPFAT